MLATRIALRYLLARKSHTEVNIISAVSMAGVAVATMAIICVLSVFNGFTRLAESRLSIFDPDFKIEAAVGKAIANPDSLAAAIAANFEDVEMLLPTIEEQALALYGDNQQAVRVKGVAENYDDFSPIDSALIDGAFIAADPSDGFHKAFATIGVGAALRLGARPTYDVRLRLLAPRRVGRINAANPLGAFRSDSLAVGAVFQIDQTEYDSELVIVPLSTARQLFDYPVEATAIEVKMVPGANLDRQQTRLQAFLGPSYAVKNRIEQQPHSYRMIAVEKWISLLLLVFILAIASFNVVSTLSMLVLEKRGDIAILRALGASRRFVDRIFMDEGFLVSLSGGAIGIVLGVALCLAQQYGGFIKLGGDPSQLSVAVYPVELRLGDTLIVIAIVLAVSVLVGWLARFIVASLGSNRRAKAE